MSAIPGKSSIAFLAVGDGYQARCLLRSGLFSALRDGAEKLVVLVPNPDEEYLRKELAAPSVVLEDLQVEGAAAYMNRSRFQGVLRSVRNYAGCAASCGR